MFTKIALGIITVAALLFIGTCVIVAVALREVSKDARTSTLASGGATVLHVKGTPGTTFTVIITEALGVKFANGIPTMPDIRGTVPQDVTIADPTQAGHWTANVKKTVSDGTLDVSFSGCRTQKGGKTSDAFGTITVTCEN